MQKIMNVQVALADVPNVIPALGRTRVSRCLQLKISHRWYDEMEAAGVSNNRSKLP